MHITPFELPRTATRKVKRPEVVEILQMLEDRNRKKTKDAADSKGDDNLLWIRKIVATVTSRPLSDIAIEDRLSDLGFDSLMFVELQAAVEDAGGRVLSPDTLNEVQSVRELLTAVQRIDKSKRLIDEPKVDEKKDEEEIHIPGIVRRVGNSLVDLAQNTFMRRAYTQIMADQACPARNFMSLQHPRISIHA